MCRSGQSGLGQWSRPASGVNIKCVSAQDGQWVSDSAQCSGGAFDSARGARCSSWSLQLVLRCRPANGSVINGLTKHRTVHHSGRPRKVARFVAATNSSETSRLNDGVLMWCCSNIDEQMSGNLGQVDNFITHSVFREIIGKFHIMPC